MRRSTFTMLALGGFAAVPGVAYATDGGAEVVTWGIGVATLLASIALLLIAVGLARVATGSAMADNISYVVAASVCMAGSVLAGWSGRLVSDPVVAAQIALGGAALDMVGILLFAIYFFRVRAVLLQFHRAVTGASRAAQVPEEAGVSSGSDATDGETR